MNENTTLTDIIDAALAIPRGESQSLILPSPPP